ncbi:hypothetical protein TIFTF001_018232 [Ficus carica]|uniref:Uncharacterized protein n=1 Tax=Ficus carica TaxID=3494 RepID=A0AA88AB22_FICCA|nr:hypothetical protein TIFTF001_018232 [Ficus carica]
MSPHLQLQARLQSPSALRRDVKPRLGGVSRQVLANTIPVDGFFSFDHVDRTTRMFRRVYQPAPAPTLGQDKNCQGHLIERQSPRQHPMFGGETRIESKKKLDGKYFVTTQYRDWYWRAYVGLC